MAAPTGAASPVLAPFLRAVAAAHVFPDSKTIVDMPLRAPPDAVAAAFAATYLPSSSKDAASNRSALLKFIETWFEPLESDLVVVADSVQSISPDVPPPPWLTACAITTAEARDWALHLYKTWGILTRASSPSVAAHPDQHTLLALPRPFVIPGSRFRECYYWDSYWVIRGLLACDLIELAHGVVSNLVHVARHYGFVPNGMRSYYLNRSQPPLLALMVYEIYKATGNKDAVIDALPVLVAEHAWWMAAPRCLTVSSPENGTAHSLCRYYADWDMPRVESLREDMETAGEAFEENRAGGESAPNPSMAQRALYRHISSAAESGWDFSSRWFRDGNNLSSIQTTQIVPVDLNALLLRAERTVAELATAVGEFGIAAQFKLHAEKRRDSINALHWDAEKQRWRDLVINKKDGGENNNNKVEVMFSPASNDHVYASDWVPLWCGCAPSCSDMAHQAVLSLKTSGLLQQGGIAASDCASGQQWDWPNVWPPLQSMLAEGCKEYGGDQGKILAKEIATRFLRTAHTAWKQTGRMFEKFDATEVGVPGGGGEYEVVDGFGWTNGLALVWLKEYGLE